MTKTIIFWNSLDLYISIGCYKCGHHICAYITLVPARRELQNCTKNHFTLTINCRDMSFKNCQKKGGNCLFHNCKICVHEHVSVHVMLCFMTSFSLVPRQRPAFRRLQYRKQGEPYLFSCKHNEINKWKNSE